MNRHFLKKGLTLFVMLCTIWACSSDNDEDEIESWKSGGNGLKIELNVQKAGTLSQLISEADMYKITNLRITGELNGSDILLIRKMAGADAASAGKLSVLDITDAEICSGGAAYYLGYKIENDRRIGPAMFHNCVSLSRIYLPKTISQIFHRAFTGCKNLTNIIIDNNSNYYSANGILCDQQQTLILCPEGKSGEINLPNSLKVIGDYAFADCANITSVEIPKSVERIGKCAFEGCKKLKNITIPPLVTTIENDTFCKCTGGLTVKIPKTVKNIGVVAFEYCKNLTLYLEAMTPPIVFRGDSDYIRINLGGDATVYVPKGAKEAYMSDSKWNGCNLIEY